MTELPTPTYSHSQTGPWFPLLWIMGAFMLALAWLLWDQPPVPSIVPVILLVAAFVLLVLGPSFHRLTVADKGDRLVIRFGFLPLFQKRIRYEDIQTVALGKTTLLDGWGVHLSLRGGSVWNIWGWDCVVIHHGGTTCIGTNDAENLAAFLRTKI